MGVNFADFKLYQGNCLDVLKQISNESVQCCITSPPYYGLRDYGTDEQIGLEETPDEYIKRLVNVFREIKRILKNDGTLWVNIGDSYGQNFRYGGDETASEKQKGNRGTVAFMGRGGQKHTA